MKRPGIMLYFDVLEPIRALTDRERGRLLTAMLEYGQTGKQPAFEGRLALAWGFVRPKIDKDEEEYRLSVLRRRYATVCRERKRKGEPEITFDRWMQSEEAKQSPVTNDDQRYPTTDTTTATAPTTAATTDTTTATAAAAAATTTADGSTAAAAQSAVKVLGGTLGKNAVFLSEAQVEDLLEQMDLEAFDYYVDKLSEFILRNGAKVKNHYETILKWYREDGVLQKGGGA